MACATDAGALDCCFSAWLDVTQAEKRERTMERSMREHETKYAMLNSKQKGLAGSAAQRANQLEDYNLMLQVFSNWVIEWEVEKVQQKYDERLQGKRQKLESVHSLFRNFADKLED